MGQLQPVPVPLDEAHVPPTPPTPPATGSLRPERTRGPGDEAIRYLTVPGLGGSGPDHWQSRWERCRDACVRVELGSWDAPNRREWIAALDAAVRAAPGRVVLIGHSLGCTTIAWWAAAAAAAPALLARVSAAMLVAPPDLGQQGTDVRLLRFAPTPAAPLPFRALVVASADDRYATLARSEALARAWNARFVAVGRAGHINAESGLGDWAAGQALLAGLAAA